MFDNHSGIEAVLSSEQLSIKCNLYQWIEQMLRILN